MQLQATLLLLVLGLAACGESPPAPAAVPATPRRVASEPVEAPAEVVLVAPESEAAAETSLVESIAGQPTSSGPAPYQPVQAPQPSSAVSTPSRAERPSKSVPLARDRKGKILGRGPRRGERPTVSMGSASSKYASPKRGRKIRKPGGSKAAAEPKAQPAEETSESPATGDPRR